MCAHIAMTLASTQRAEDVTRISRSEFRKGNDIPEECVAHLESAYANWLTEPLDTICNLIDQSSTRETADSTERKARSKPKS